MISSRPPERFFRYLPPVAWLAAVVLFVQRFVAGYQAGGPRLDELFSLWASDPAGSLWDMQIDKLACETNPPLHYWLMYGLQMVLGAGRTTGLVLNGLTIAVTLGGLIWLARRAGRPALGWWLGAVYLCSAATITQTQDVRPYCLAVSVCALLATQVSLLRRAESISRVDTGITVALAATAGITHVYAALFVFCLTSAVALEGVLRQTGPWRERSLLRLAVLTGGACAMTFGLWGVGLVRNTGRHPPSIEWIRFDYPSVSTAFVWDSLVQVGPPVALGLFLIAIAIACGARRPGGTLCVAFVTAALFFVMPLLISFLKPIIHAQYYPVGGAALLILLAFATIEAWAEERRQADWRSHTALAGLAVALALPLLCSGMASRAWADNKLVWRSAEIVRAQAPSCPERRVRVVPPPWGMQGKLYPGFAYILRDSGLTVEDSRDTLRDVSDIDCSVVAWSEDSQKPNWPESLSEEERLKVFNLTNREHVPLTLRRYGDGYVVTKVSAYGRHQASAIK